MKILWLTWKDLNHPLAGGAEVVNEELAKRLAADGHEILFLVGGYDNCAADEKIDGYSVRRFVRRTSVIWWPLRCWQMFRYYRKHLRGWPDLVIDEVNTMPFFVKFYVREPNILLIYMLSRKIWFYEFPMLLSWIGYLVEPVYLWPLRDRKVLTESQSTKDDLIKHGFKGENISIFNIGTEMKPIKSLEDTKKYDTPTLLSLGAIRPMKRTHHQLKAFELAKQKVPNLKLKIAGDASGNYGKKLLQMIKNSQYAKDIEYLGRVTKDQKVELMQKSHLIMVTSAKEGWGLIVTEAASQGTPAVVYDVDGLRDSVQHKKTGLVCSHNTPADLAENIKVLIDDHKRYNKYRKNAWIWSREFNFERSYQAFKKTINL